MKTLYMSAADLGPVADVAVLTMAYRQWVARYAVALHEWFIRRLISLLSERQSGTVLETAIDQVGGNSRLFR